MDRQLSMWSWCRTNFQTFLILNLDMIGHVAIAKVKEAVLAVTGA
jgi:hypothetical protein